MDNNGNIRKSYTELGMKLLILKIYLFYIIVT